MKTPILLALAFVAACGGKSTTPTTTTPPPKAADSATLVMSMNGATVTATLESGGTIHVAIKDGDKSDQKDGKFADNQLFDPKGEAIAKLGADGTITTRMVTETSVAGQPPKAEAQWNEVGKVDDTGTFTAKTPGTTLAIGADGKVTGLPPEMTASIDAKSPVMKRRAMFMLVAALSGGTARVTSDPPTSSAPASM